MEDDFVEITPELIHKLGVSVTNQEEPLTERMRAIFTLRGIGTNEAVDAMKDGMFDPSVLLAHEVAYCLGQMRNSHAIPYLEQVLRNESLDSMVRHEAGEALGAIGELESISILNEFINHPLSEIRETCQVAIDLINWRLEHKDAPIIEEDCEFLSVDPAPSSKKKSVPELQNQLNDHQLTIFERYKALFKLRNIATEEAVLAICSSLYDDTNGPLFLHEVAYVLGQLRHPASLEALAHVLKNPQHHDMVRHEAAEAIGNLDTTESVKVLENYKEDKTTVVRHSCEVALDIHSYNNSNEFQYGNQIQNNS